MNFLVAQFLIKNSVAQLEAGPLVKINLSRSKSKIIQANNNSVYCFSITGLEGLFRKDRTDTKLYGHITCDLVQREFQCGGFFTSDELPRYGITELEIEHLYRTMNKQIGDGQLIIFLAYPYLLAEQIRSFLIELFCKQVKEHSDKTNA